MFKIEKDKIKSKSKSKRIVFIYDTDKSDNKWVYDILDRGNYFYRKHFYFKNDDLLSLDRDPDEKVIFAISGQKDKRGYYNVPRRILNLKYDLYIHESIDISKRTFLTDDDSLSIFSNLNEFNLEEVWIGGSHKNAVSNVVFEEIIKSVPSRHEKHLYATARIDAVLRNYFDTNTEAEEKFKKYLNKKKSLSQRNLKNSLKSYELEKYELILERLRGMLENESSYNEKQWQREILDIILLLYPKYIHVFKNTPIKDYDGKDRYLDFLLVDSGGHVDIIEIKQPFDNCIVTKAQYRDNYIPLRELSGTVMQIEKYLFYLRGWAKKGEQYLTNKFGADLPGGLNIKITNPSGLIIMGRESGLDTKQLRDFEVIKRQYKNVVDILTYDDLIRRLHFIITQIKKT